MPAAPFDAYMLCTAPRSGSTLLCALLSATGIAGNPNSHFHEPSLQQWCKAHGVSPQATRGRSDTLRAVFAAARANGSGGTPIFGLRMQQKSFAYFLEALRTLHGDRSNDAERIEAAFGRTAFVHLTRSDKVAQAISLVLAQQTGLWHRGADGQELERLDPHREPQYDRAAIARTITDLTAMDDAWHAWFAQHNLTPLAIEYETLASDPGRTLARVLDDLRLDAAAARGAFAPTAKLATRLNEEWRGRFLAERPMGAQTARG